MPAPTKKEKAEAARIRRLAKFAVFRDGLKTRKDAVKTKEAALKAAAAQGAPNG